MRLKRPLFGPQTPQGPSKGRDVWAVKRALDKTKAAELPGPAFDEVYNQLVVDEMKKFQKVKGIRPTGHFGQDTLDELEPFFDEYGKRVYEHFTIPPTPPPKTPAELRFDDLLGAMQLLDKHSQGYILGAGHGSPLMELDPDDFFDCSSSSSFVLKKADMFEGSYAIVSGRFVSEWGLPGKGELFTVYANDEHVWIRLHRSRWWRFDTSPHAGGKPSENPRRGPRLRYFPRFTSSFTPRHWPGM